MNERDRELMRKTFKKIRSRKDIEYDVVFVDFKKKKVTKRDFKIIGVDNAGKTDLPCKGHNKVRNNK